jgi:hypothetical protein
MNPRLGHEVSASPADLPHFRFSEEHLARIAARRAFVELKTTFMRAAIDAAGPTGELLRRRVRDADEALQLWRLRFSLLAALPAQHERTEQHRAELMRQLDSVFPDTGPEAGFAPLL